MVYDADLLVNRVVMILLTAICLTILYRLFTTTERSGNLETLTALNLSTAAEGVYYQESSPATLIAELERPDYCTYVPGPEVLSVNDGMRANLNKLIAALGVEFHLLRVERSLVVILPLAVGLSILEVAFYNIPPDVSYSAAYATNTAKLMLLFLLGIAVFYTGEAMHRDREVRIEPVLWGTPTPNIVLLLSKFLATLVLLVGLILLVGFAAVVIQILRGHTPIDLLAYLQVYGIILLPGALFVTSISLALNVVLRNKHVTYVVSIGTGVGLFYLYSIGYNHWLYNPMMFGLWSYSDLTQGTTLLAIVWRRVFWLAAALVSLGLAHFLFERKSGRRHS